MDNPFVVAGLACVIAAIVGGGLKAFGIEVPLLKSRTRQSVLGILGILLLTFGLGVLRLPKHTEPTKPVTLVTAWSTPQSIGPNQGAMISVRAMTEGTCESRAIVSIRDTSGGRFQPSGTTTVSGGQFDDHCEFSVLWSPPPESAQPAQNVYHDMQAEVIEDGATIGTAQVSVLVHP
jgi:hypothetical protein